MDFELINGENVLFITKKNTECALIKFVKPDKIYCWGKLNSDSMYPLVITPFQVPINDLKSMHIWDQLSDSLQKDLHKQMEEDKTENNLKMAKARQNRRKKYPDMPREYECINCHIKQAIHPAVVSKRLEKNGILLDDFIKDFHCQKCRPSKRGRQASMSKQAIYFKTLPAMLVCKCGRKIKANYSYLTKKAEKLGVTMDSLVKGYICQRCNPTKGRKKKVRDVVVSKKKKGKRGRPKKK